MSVVYFIQAGAVGPIKIGTATDIAKRVNALQTGCPEPLVVLATIEGDETTERRLHDFLAPWRHWGEWFKPSPEVLRVIDAAREGRLPDWPPAVHVHVSALSELVERFRAHIRTRGISLQGFAADCGLHRNTLLGHERDDWNPNLKTLLAIEAELHRRTPVSPAATSSQAARPMAQGASSLLAPCAGGLS